MKCQQNQIQSSLSEFFQMRLLCKRITVLETRDSSLPIQHRSLLGVFTTVGNPGTFSNYKSPFNISNAQVSFYTDLAQSKCSQFVRKGNCITNKNRCQEISQQVAVGQFPGGEHSSPRKPLLQKDKKYSIPFVSI